MTSQHFNNDWEDWGDWGEKGTSGNANNNVAKPAVQQPVGVSQPHQNFAAPPLNAPIYSPFAFQQPAFQQQPAAQALHQPNPQLQASSFPSQAAAQVHGMPPSVPSLSKSFFNSSGDNVNNNSTSSAFGQAPPIASSFYDSPQSVHNVPSYQNDSALQYQHPTAVRSFQSSQPPFMPSPSTSPMQLPPPPQSENIADDLYTSNQQKNLPAPPPSFAFKQQQQRTTFDYHQPTNNLDSFNVHNWQANGVNQAYQQKQTPASTLESFSNHQQLPTSVDHRQDSYGFGSSSRFFENHEVAASEVAPEMVSQLPLSIPEPFYPENRERLDDVSTPPGRSSSFTDRHNYLVTGQLSQERISLPHQQQHQTQIDTIESNAEELPPPGLSRMVVGQPENIQDQSSVPPRSNRQVTGTETTPSSYLNYQRQADGEMSHSPTPNTFSNTLHNHSNVTEVTSSSDRNLYLVAGESDANNQRVIPGVESHSNLSTNVVTSMQNLHIQQDDSILIVSAERNLNVDGMETVAIDNQSREEEIDGANDNSENLTMPVIDYSASNEQESDVREEAIEGANAEVDRSKDKQKSDIGLSSEDSELRALETTKVKPKARRSKKYDDESNESEVSEGEKREFKKHPREKPSRDDYRRRDGDRRPRKHDDTDGSKYGDSKRRTDDEEEYRKGRKKGSRRHQEGDEVDEKERKKRDKYRESRRKDYAYDDDRRERRRREKYYDDESYAGRRSQNTSDREYPSDRYNRRSKDHPDRASAYYQQYAAYDPSSYNMSSYYQQQQYYETLRRTNPQAYYEWYTKYMAMIQQQQARPQQPIDDVGGSMRSGYSSGNENRTGSRFHLGGDVSNPLRSMDTSFIDNTDYQSLQGFASAVKDMNSTYASLGYGYDVYGRDKPAHGENQEVQRSTPKKFQSLHNYVRLSNGLMTTIDSASSGTVKIESMPIFDKTRRSLQSYPGPLVRGVSHKKTVIEFCEDRMKQDQSVAGSQRASFTLLWSYLILMLRQNGNYTEGDISELLMKNSAEFKLNADASTAEDHKNTTNEDSTDVSEGEENNSASQSQEETTASSMTDRIVLHKFRDYLLYGNINDALDFATDNNLWGHALFLASKVDRRQHANVMLKFANKLPYNDPLQTLYQIMSGRMPACVSNLDDKWGDWRPHLAMIISNCTDKPDLVKRSIMTLGDSLASRGDVFGSQFCYLLVEPHFKEFSDPSSDFKITLLGTTNQKSFKDFATDDAIIMSEVYEYARSLSEENFFVPALQKYKFLLAGKMLDYGMQLKCLLYMEQISKCIAMQPDVFDINFISRVYSLGDRLKFYDPVMEKSYEDNFNNNEADATEDQKWLQDLATLLGSVDEIKYQQQYQQSTEEQTPQHSVSDAYTPNQGIYDPMSQHQTPTHVSTTYEGDQYQAYQPEQAAPAENYAQYQQPEQPYSHEYSNPIQSEQQNHYQPQLPAEQAPYDPNAHNNYQPTAQADYGGYGGWDQNYQQQQPQPTITMGNSVSNKFENNAASSGSDVAAKKPQPSKQEGDKAKKAPAADSAKSGWFGGIFSKLSMKPKNQMILPEDKDPTIVWDETTKKWVNKDGDVAESESLKPPPKMSDMMGGPPSVPMQAPSLPQMSPMQQYPQQQAPAQPQASPMMMQQPQPGAIPMVQPQQQLQSQPQMQGQPQIAPSGDGQLPPAPSAPNMFKMQKGRNLKKSYVDILGNSGQTVSQPKDIAPGMQFFNPVQQPQQFYNPNDFN